MPVVFQSIMSDSCRYTWKEGNKEEEGMEGIKEKDEGRKERKDGGGKKGRGRISHTGRRLEKSPDLLSHL